MSRGRAVAPLAALIASALSCGAPPSADRIVLVTLDTTRADHLGCYGSPAGATPHIDALARSATLFENALATVPATLPSHASMLTGEYPQGHGVRYNVTYTLSSKAVTVAEILHDAGWATAAFPSSFILAPRFGLNQGFDVYDAPPPPAEPGSLESERKAADAVDLALRWLASHPDGPQLLWLHLYDPHWPYAPPFPYSARFKDSPYTGEIAYADAELGRLFDALQRGPRWARTALIVVGDHGEGLFEHGERYHSLLTYDTTLHVPMLVSAPGRRAARKVATPVTVADLGPTMLALAGRPIPPSMQGRSLAEALDGREPERRPVYFESLVGALNYGWSALEGVRDGRFKFVESSRPELYDVQKDPGETTNLASLETQRVADMRAELGDLVARTTSRVERHDVSPSLDPDTLATLASLGYVSGGGTGPTAMTGPHPATLVDLEPEMLNAQGAMAGRRWDRLLEICTYVLSRDPNNRFALYHRAFALAQTGRAGEAEPFARRLVELYPDAETNHDLLAQIQSSEGRPKEALASLEKGLEVFPDSELLGYHAAVAAFDARRPDVCSAFVAPLVAKHGTSDRAWLLDARCAAVAGDRPRALGSLRKAASLGFTGFEAIGEIPEMRSVARTPEFRAMAAAARNGQKAAGTPAPPAAGVAGPATSP